MIKINYKTHPILYWQHITFFLSKNYKTRGSNEKYSAKNILLIKNINILTYKK